MTQRETKHALQNRMYKLARLLSEYEQFLERRLSTNIKIEKRNTGTNEEPDWRDFVVVEFYSYKILERQDNFSLEAYRDSETREFEFTPEGLDRAINRWRKKVTREYAKRNGQEIADEEDPVVIDERTGQPLGKGVAI